MISWAQIGQDIDGEKYLDESGYSVSLSGDGTTVVIGALNTERVRVYKRDASIAGWAKIGKDILGVGDGEFGWSVSLSDNGTIMAIGAPKTTGVNGPESGRVRVYARDANNANGWTQIGQDIDGENSYDQSGYSVSLSADGTIVAIGATGSGGKGSYSGHVRVYVRDANNANGWVQVGGDIDGEASYDYSGYSVSLSADGTTVAIGARYNGGTAYRSGHARVYKFVAAVGNTAAKWDQLGGDIDGEAFYDYFGQSVSLSADGTIVAIGANKNDGNGEDSGHVRVHKFVAATETTAAKWDQLGTDIDGEAAYDNSGRAVSLSADGTIVAIGAPYNDGLNEMKINSGHVRVYKFVEFEVVGTAYSQWEQLGTDIDGEAVNDWSGWSVSLSDNGTTGITVAIGAQKNNGNYKAGHVRVYDIGPLNSTPLKSSDFSFTSNNSNNTLAKAADTVTLSFTSNITPLVTFKSGGNPVKNSTILNSAGNIWTASYIIDQSDTEGHVTYSIAFDNGVIVTPALVSGTGSVLIFEPPVITLKGVNPVKYKKGTTYVEEGAKSNGPETVYISGSVDTSILGTHTITYTTSKDEAGNIGTATRTVNVRDDAPAFTVNNFSTITQIDTPYTYTPKFNDFNFGGYDNVEFNHTLPAWLNLDISTGILSGTPSNADVGVNSVVLKVTDPAGEDTLTFNIIVTISALANVHVNNVTRRELLGAYNLLYGSTTANTVLQTEVGTLTTANTVLQTEVGTLTTANTVLQTEVGTLTTASTVLQSEVGTLSNDISDLKSSNSSLSSNITKIIQSMKKR